MWQTGSTTFLTCPSSGWVCFWSAIFDMSPVSIDSIAGLPASPLIFRLSLAHLHATAHGHIPIHLHGLHACLRRALLSAELADVAFDFLPQLAVTGLAKVSPPMTKTETTPSKSFTVFIRSSPSSN